MAETPVLVADDLARHFDVSPPLLQRRLAGEGKRTLKAGTAPSQCSTPVISPSLNWPKT